MTPPPAVLLDTPVLLWALVNPEVLSPTARAVLENWSTTLYVSAATALEVAIKQKMGRLPDVSAVVTGYDRHLERLKAIELPITGRHALLAGSFPGTYGDPFDRLIAAQALTEGLPIVSRDPLLRSFDVRLIW
jgi:PIN domain nuclease of toxin-antitoxin system